MNFNISVKKAVKMKNILITIFGVLILLFTGCDYFENGDTLNSSTIEINISGLPALPDTMTYVAWFDNEDTQIKPLMVYYDDAVNGDFKFKSEMPLSALQQAQLFWLTIEDERRVEDSAFTISTRRVLGGRFSFGSCNLGIAENTINFDGYSVVYNLLTPTDGSNANETSGVWFVEIDNEGGFSTGLNLPVLYGYWIYEGWVEVNGQYLSTGRFRNPVGADLSNLYGASGSVLSFPGEDFLNNPPAGINFPLDLRGKKLYVSAELRDGRTAGDSPYVILFEATIPSDAQPRTKYEMTKFQNPAGPFGQAVIKVDLVK